LFAGILVARHSSHIGDDLILLRLAASKLARAGRLQKARDLTEQGLQLAGEDSLRARLAWFAYADVYQRLHNPLEALIGIACTFACSAEITTEQAWYEIYLLMRLFRDLHMADLAKPLLPRGQALVRDLGPDGEYQHRFATLELGLRLFELEPGRGGGQAEVEAFVSDAEKLCSTVLARNDEIAPAATLLAHGIYLGRFRRLAVPENATRTLELVLARIEEPLRTTIRALTIETPAPTKFFKRWMTKITLRSLSSLAAGAVSRKFHTQNGQTLTFSTASSPCVPNLYGALLRRRRPSPGHAVAVLQEYDRPRACGNLRVLERRPLQPGSGDCRCALSAEHV
jgi:hypothetical protein